MQRSSIIGDIYGYLVCLLAIVIFVHAAAGFINSAFGGSPGMGFHRTMLMTMRGGPGGPMWRGQMRGTMPRWNMNPDVTISPPPGAPQVQVAARIHRGPDVRGLVVNAVLLLIAVLLFGWHWRWLRTRPA